MLRIALAQINPTVGDLPGNRDKITRFIKVAEEKGADILVFPEMSLTGYPPEDLLLKPYFLSDCQTVIKDIVKYEKCYCQVFECFLQTGPYQDWIIIYINLTWFIP